MKQKGAAKTKVERKKILVFFGEDAHDRDAISTLLFALIKTPGKYKKKPLKKPITLVKDLEAAKRRARTTAVEAAVRAVSVEGEVYATIFHEDADAVEPAHEERERAILEAYKRVRGTIVAAVPAWELEAWWLLFPTAVGCINDNWRDPDQYVNREVGRLRDAKEILAKSVRPPGVKRGARFREYRESDSAQIAQNIVSMGLIENPQGRSASWDSFVRQIKQL